MTDFLIGILFWGVYEALTWPARLALAAAPMRGDLRRMLSRVAGPAAIAMVVWLAGHGGLPLSAFTTWVFYVVGVAGAFWICRAAGVKVSLWRTISPITDRKRWKQEAFIEGFGLVIFFSYLAFRRLAPEMTTYELDNSGAEKFGNAMLFWSSWHARSLPPQDYWLAGERQVYYYWGHYFWAWVGRAGGFPGEWVITLAMARLTQLIWEASYLLVRACGARPISACLGALMITWGGNPKAVETVYKFYDASTGRAFEEPTTRIFPFAPRYLGQIGGPHWSIENYVPYFWEASRVIDAPNGSVNEFPAWSALLGDFHAHHLSIPWTIAFLALVVGGERWFRLRREGKTQPGPRLRQGFGGQAAVPQGFSRREKTQPRARESSRAVLHANSSFGADVLHASSYGFAIRIGLFGALFVVTGVAGVIANAWVAPLVGLAATGIFLWRWWRGGAGILLRGGLVVVLGAAMILGIKLIRGPQTTPFSAEVRVGEGGILSRLPVGLLPAEVRSTLGELFGLWGFQGLVLIAGILGFGAFAILRGRSRGPAILLGLAAAIMFVQIAFLRSESGLIWLGLASALGSLALGRRPWFSPGAAFLACSSCLVLAGLERFYIKDQISGSPGFERYNTYFKLMYPVWPALTACAWICAQRLWHARLPRGGRLAIRCALVANLPFIFLLVVFGAPARSKQAAAPDARPRSSTLNAFDWLQYRAGYEAENDMLKWIRAHVPPGEVVVEADTTTSAYVYVGRVASLAGRPIPVGWDRHELQWRGEAAIPSIHRNRDFVNRVYEAPTAEEMLAAARAAGWKWIVFGSSEAKRYGPERGREIVARLREAGRLRAQFPASKPAAYVFEIENANEGQE